MGDEGAEVLDGFQGLRGGFPDMAALVAHHAGGSGDAELRDEV